MTIDEDLSDITDSFINKERLAGLSPNTSLLDSVTIDYEILVVRENVIRNDKLHFVNDEVVATALDSFSGDFPIPILLKNCSDDKVKISGTMDERS